MNELELKKQYGVCFPTDVTKIDNESFACLNFPYLFPDNGLSHLSREEVLCTFATYLSRYGDSTSISFRVWENQSWGVCGCDFNNSSTVVGQDVSMYSEASFGEGVAVGIALDPIPEEVIRGKHVDYLIDVSNVSDLSIHFNLAKFLPGAVQHRGEAFVNLIRSVVSNPEIPAGQHELGTALDAQFTSSLGHHGSIEQYDLDTPVFMKFCQQAQLTPDAEAIRFLDRALTYQQLDRKSNQLAHYLASQGVGVGAAIGIFLERSDSVVVTMLAVQKLGAMYIPLDPSYPADRIDHIAEDSDLRMLVTEETLAQRISTKSLQLVLLNEAGEEVQRQSCELPDVQVDSDSKIYSIYTSGSTGKPKGMGVKHRNVNLYLQSQNELLGVQNNKRVLALASFCFDVSTAEIYCTLLTGGCVVMATRGDATNPIALAKLIRDQDISLMHATPSSWRLLLESGWDGQDLLAITAGEPFPRELIKPLTKLTRELWNFYGPTETTVYATCYQIDPTDDFVHIGKPMPGYKVEVRDEHGLPAPLGASGELWIGGEGVVDGYLNRSDLNAVQFCEIGSDRYYRTGDAVRLHTNGFIEYFSRIDGQVKVNGYRIELGEIEAVLSEHPAIKRGVAGVQLEGAEKQLVLWYVCQPDSTEAVDPSELKKFLASRLPAYMIPTAWKHIDEVPLNPNGKVDRKALPKIVYQDKSENATEKDTLEISTQQLLRIAENQWYEVLGKQNCDKNASFFDLGGTSMQALGYVNRLNQRTGGSVNIVDLFSHASLDQWLKFLGTEYIDQHIQTHQEKKNTSTNQDIAIVGMAVHVPGAKDISSFWDNIVNGRESISRFSAEELAEELSPSVTNSSSYVPYRGILEDYDAFDDQFFGMTPREAKVTDPQHRLFLQTAWHAIEDSGHVLSESQELVGVYAGSYYNTYHVNNVSAHEDVVAGIGHLQEMIASEKDYIATRVAHKLNLKGPAISVHTACSTSLVAISQACLGLNGNQCDVAIAGAASVTAPTKSGHEYQEDGVFSKDGHTRTFSEDATGTTFSDGVGAVVLKRLDDAIASGDRIYAVIKSASVNNDGGGKMSFMAPSSEGQAAVIESAIRGSGVEVESITYVEAHGTATRVGDPIEVEGLRKAFGKFTDKKQFCAIGSVKSNLGHLTAAAGVIGVVKTALSIHNKVIPPSLHAEPINPAINFEDSPFYPVTQKSSWVSSDYPRRAGVSSFGVGGTNAHAILEEHVVSVTDAPSGTEQSPELLLISAKSKAALDRTTDQLGAHLSQENANVCDTAYTLAQRRQFFGERRFVVTGKDQGEISSRLTTLHSSYSASASYTGAANKVAFMFPGQGCQYAGMGAELYESELVFKQAVDACADILDSHLQIDVRDLLLAKGDDLVTAKVLITETQYSQPCLFVMGYGLYKLWSAWGVLPSAVIGHSVGEIVAAHIAGVFSLEDALLLVASRGRLMQDLPTGAMVSVRLGAEDVEPLLIEGLSIAAINGAASCVVAGEHQKIDQFCNKCEQQDIALRRLQTSHAFHSEMMEPAVQPFSDIVGCTRRSKPAIPIMSTANASWLNDEDATDPSYWGAHLRNPVRFAEGIQSLWSDDDYVLLELGPRSTASTLALQQAKDRKKHIAIPSLQHAHEKDSELEALYAAVGRLWITGCHIDLAAFRYNRSGSFQSLPCYPFEKNRHWLSSRNSMKHSEISTSKVSQETVNDCSERDNSSCERGFSVLNRLAEIFESSTDRSIDEEELSISFMGLGMDSLALIQFSNAVKQAFGFRPSMRQLMGELETISSLATYIEVHYHVPEVSKSVSVENNFPASSSNASAVDPKDMTMMCIDEVSLEDTVRAQLKNIQQLLELANQQLDILSNSRKRRNQPGVSAAEPTKPSDEEDCTEPCYSPEVCRDLSYNSSNKGMPHGEAPPAIESHLGTRYRLTFDDENIATWKTRDDRSDQGFAEPS